EAYLQSMRRQRFRQGFGIRMAAESVGKVLAQGEMAVGLAVIGEQPTPVAAGHRLMSGRAQIEDRKAGVAQEHLPAAQLLGRDPFAVGTAMAQGGETRLRVERSSRIGNSAEDSTHRALPPN